MKFIWLICIFLLFSCGNPVDNIVIRGSDTEVNLVLQLAENYMDQNEGVSIAVTGGGSGTGIAALINKNTHIANSSRSFTSYEKELAQSRGIEVVPIVFALDAICFIVHEDLNLKSVTLSEAKDIFSGKIDNWSSLANWDREVSLYGRQGNSGTFLYVRDQILQKDYSMAMKQMNGTSQIIEGVRNDPAGIGYVGVGYVVNPEGNPIDGIKILGIQPQKNANIHYPLDSLQQLNEEYPFVRPLYQYVDGVPSGHLRDFILYELSVEGQMLTSRNGYFPVSDKFSSLNQSWLNHEFVSD